MSKNSYGGQFDTAFTRGVRACICERRLEFGDIARLINAPTETVRHWITGVMPISDPNRAKLASALGVDPETGEDRCDACGDRPPSPKRKPLDH